MNLNEYLEQYRILTLSIINEIGKDGEIDALLKQRGELLNLINNLNVDGKYIKEIGNALNLLQLEEELHSLVKKEKVEVRKQIENIKRMKKVNTNYNKFENVARVFSKTI